MRDTQSINYNEFYFNTIFLILSYTNYQYLGLIIPQELMKLF